MNDDDNTLSPGEQPADATGPIDDPLRGKLIRQLRVRYLPAEDAFLVASPVASADLTPAGTPYYPPGQEIDFDFQDLVGALGYGSARALARLARYRPGQWTRVVFRSPVEARKLFG